MTRETVTCVLMTLLTWASGELLSNGNFEGGQNHWDCWEIQCHADGASSHSGHLGLHVTGRHQNWQGPSQYITVQPGLLYTVSGWIKLLNGNSAYRVDMELGYKVSGGSDHYITAASQNNVRSSDGWIHLTGSFTAPTPAPEWARIYFQVSDASVNFAVDDASVRGQGGNSATSHTSSGTVDQDIDRLRRSNIHISVTTASGLNKDEIEIHVLQTRKAFPFGTAVNVHKYNADAAGGKYRDFIHKHFNWVVPENALKWPSIEPHRGQTNYQPALTMIHGVRSHGIKVRGHNLVWSVDRWVQQWVKQLHGDELRTVVRNHIQDTMQHTHGLLEHWDVNNENLHGTWYQHQLHDNDYNLELFRIAHAADASVKLFLNDYNVVANGASTNAYLAQARKFKAANVGLYGLGAQCHFGLEQEPSTHSVKQHLDTLAQAGVPIWATELDVQAADENKRADFYEKALRALYSHPAVEGILFWGFWDQAHWRGEKASLVKGNNLDLTAAGHRVLDLLENQWMTDETFVLSESGDQVTLRGFHGDYEVHVIYQGQNLAGLKQTFSLGKGDHSIHLNVHT